MAEIGIKETWGLLRGYWFRMGRGEISGSSSGHQVRFYEVVSAFDDPNGYEITDSARHEDRCMWVGSTVAGRVLAVVYSEEELPLYRLVTAFDAEGRLLNEYRIRAGV